MRKFCDLRNWKIVLKQERTGAVKTYKSIACEKKPLIAVSSPQFYLQEVGDSVQVVK